MDTKAELINTLGEPTEIMNYSSGAVRYSYIASENSNIRFKLNSDDKITMISITISHNFNEVLE